MFEDWRKFFNDKKIIAIDPGANGGIAVYSKERDMLIDVTPMPPTPGDVLEYITRFQVHARCYLEKVGGMPHQGGSAMFNFGKGFGQLEMALLARRVPTVEVTPQKWQKALSLGTKGDKTTTQWKNKLKERAMQLYPGIKVTLATADALLILEYARMAEKSRVYENALSE